MTGEEMTKDDLINCLVSISEDCYWASGCSHEDALQGALEDANEDINGLIKRVQEELKDT